MNGVSYMLCAMWGAVSTIRAVLRYISRDYHYAGMICAFAFWPMTSIAREYLLGGYPIGASLVGTVAIMCLFGAIISFVPHHHRRTLANNEVAVPHHEYLFMRRIVNTYNKSQAVAPVDAVPVKRTRALRVKSKS